MKIKIKFRLKNGDEIYKWYEINEAQVNAESITFVEIITENNSKHFYNITDLSDAFESYINE